MRLSADLLVPHVPGCVAGRCLGSTQCLARYSPVQHLACRLACHSSEVPESPADLAPHGPPPLQLTSSEGKASSGAAAIINLPGSSAPINTGSPAMSFPTSFGTANSVVNMETWIVQELCDQGPLSRAVQHKRFFTGNEELDMVGAHLTACCLLPGW